jgi:hypothetical protein
MALKADANWSALLQTIRTLAERTKMKRRQALQQGGLPMKELEQLKARVDELEKAVQMLTEIVENIVKQEAKASNRKFWLRWIR